MFQKQFGDPNDKPLFEKLFALPLGKNCLFSIEITRLLSLEPKQGIPENYNDVNHFIITWMLHQTFMYSDKVILEATFNNDASTSTPPPPSLLLLDVRTVQ